jgi:hypothetical protein
MRKSVKRSLLMWPLIASATLSLGSVFQSLRSEPSVRGWDATKVTTWVTAQLSSLRLSDRQLAQAMDIEPISGVADRVEVEPKFNADESPGSISGSQLRRSAGRRPLVMSSRFVETWRIGTPFVITEPLIGKTAATTSQRDMASDRGPFATDFDLPPAAIRHFDLNNRFDAFPIGPLRLSFLVSRPEANLDNAPIKSRLPESARVLAKPIAESASESVPSLRIARVEAPSRPTRATLTVWPTTPALSTMLQQLDGSPNASYAAWVSNVREALKSLQQLDRLADVQALAFIDDLGELSVEGQRLAQAVQEREVQTNWMRVNHAIERRVAVWRAVHIVVSSHSAGNQDEASSPSVITAKANPDALAANLDVAEAVRLVRESLPPTGDVEGWNRYLLLDEIESVTQTKVPGTAERLTLAQNFLSRLHWHGLTIEAKEIVNRDEIQTLARMIRPWAGGAIDYIKLLQRIERQESDSTDLVSRDIADALMTLRHSDDARAVDVAAALMTHYQNANVRIAISADMINRLVPNVEPKTVPVQTTMLGSKVRGVSTVNSDLSVALEPADDRWAMRLEAKGQVNTSSTSNRDGVFIRTIGDNSFDAGKKIEITRDGATVLPTQVATSGTVRLRGIQSRYDSWPIIGSIVQAIAGDKFDSARPLSQRIANRRIQTQVAQEIDTQVDQKIDVAREKFSELLIVPMGRMSLQPQVVDLKSTERELIGRYRLAGDWQTAASTPRPRSPQNSLMNVQVHQSALNNTLEQVIPRDTLMPLEDVVTKSLAAFDRTIAIPENFPQGVKIQFTSTRPITIEIEDGKLWITMRVVTLSRGTSGSLSKFIIRAPYTPEVDGINARLVRDGALRISGPGISMRERLPLRAIFNLVLPEHRPIPLTLPSLADDARMQGLAINQLELRDGWLALSVGKAESSAKEAESDRIAERQP